MCTHTHEQSIFSNRQFACQRRTGNSHIDDGREKKIPKYKKQKEKKKNQLKLIKNFLLPNYAYKNTKIPARSTKKFCKNKNVLKTLCKLGQISSRFANNLRRETEKKKGEQKTKVKTVETLEKWDEKLHQTHLVSFNGLFTMQFVRFLIKWATRKVATRPRQRQLFRQEVSSV